MWTFLDCYYQSLKLGKLMTPILNFDGSVQNAVFLWSIYYDTTLQVLNLAIEEAQITVFVIFEKVRNISDIQVALIVFI